MKILNLIVFAFEAVANFFGWKRESKSSDLVKESKDKQLKLIAAIEKEREKRTEESAAKADFLRSELIKEKKKYEKFIANL